MSARPQDLLALPESQIDGWLDSAVPALRQAINIVECMFDAEAVIIGGLMPESLVAQLIKRLVPLHRSVRSKYLDGLRVRLGTTGADTAALGAAALPLFDEFNPRYEVLLKS